MEVRPLQIILLCGLLSLAAIPFCRADAPTTAPSDSQISTLIEKLGDDDPAVRKDAFSQLLDAGPAAKQQLQASANDPDPEIRAQVRQLLTSPPLPGEAPPGMAGGPLLRYSSSVVGNTMIKDITLRGRTTHIEQGAGGIQMTVTGFIDGQQVTQRFSAKDADALKEQSPDAFDLWQQLGGPGTAMKLGPNLVLNGLNGAVIVNGGIAGIPGGDDITRLAADLDGQMQKSKLTDTQKEQIRQQVKTVEADQASEQQAQAALPPELLKRQADYLTACDDLRKLIAAAGLPDPGTTLPPPASARLGVTISADTPLQGISIVEIQPDSRASKMGLQIGDVIMSVNGKRVTNTQDLRSLVMANKQLNLSVNRNGQDLKLTEPAANNPTTEKSDTPSMPVSPPVTVTPQ